LEGEDAAAIVGNDGADTSAKIHRGTLHRQTTITWCMIHTFVTALFGDNVKHLPARRSHGDHWCTRPVVHIRTRRAAGGVSRRVWLGARRCGGWVAHLRAATGGVGRSSGGTRDDVGGPASVVA